MPRCTKIRRRKRQVCVGDMNDQVTLNDRDITPPPFGSADFDENFSNPQPVWAAVDTVSGKTFFDGVNQDVNITHLIKIGFDPSVTTQTWVILDTRRLRILDVQDLDERHQFMILTCTDRGDVSVEASKI